MTPSEILLRARMCRVRVRGDAPNLRDARGGNRGDDRGGGRDNVRGGDSRGGVRGRGGGGGGILRSGEGSFAWRFVLRREPRLRRSPPQTRSIHRRPNCPVYR